MWLTWGRRLDKPAGRPLTPAGLRTAEVTARRGLQTPKARLPGGGARSRFAYGIDRQYSATQAHEAARTGTSRRTTCPLPPGQRQPLRPCGHSGAALSRASGALLLTRRAHNCGAHNGMPSSRTDDILTNRQTPSQPQLPGHVLQLTFRTHYLTRESAQEITYIQSFTSVTLD